MLLSLIISVACMHHLSIFLCNCILANEFTFNFSDDRLLRDVMDGVLVLSRLVVTGGHHVEWTIDIVFLLLPDIIVGRYQENDVDCWRLFNLFIVFIGLYIYIMNLSSNSAFCFSYQLISCRYGLPVCYADTWEIAVVRSVRRDSFDQLAVCRFLTRSFSC